MKKRRPVGDPCEYCPGRVRRRRMTVDFRQGENLVIVEGVPAGVCNLCRHRYYDGKVVDRLDQIMAQRRKSRRTVKVPVLKFEVVA